MDGDPVLRRVSDPVLAFDESLLRLAADLIETMRAEDGVGLAAPQVGIPQRLIVVAPPGEAPRVMVNPTIIEADDTQRSIEGCLSVPRAKWNQPVRRSKRITVLFKDTAGTIRRLRCSHALAAIVQHEIDHLDGVLFTDKVMVP
jgi:peptide deformylase